MPLGRIKSVTDLVRFSPSVPASDVYKSGLAVHVLIGIRSPVWLLEASIDARVAPLTRAGQAVVDSTRTDGRKVDVEYASFDGFAGRVLRLGGGERERLALFGGVGFGWALVQLSAGTGVDPHNDGGVAGCAKGGLDWTPVKSGRVTFRLAGRYQIASAGVDLPNDAIVQVLTLVRF